LRFKLTATALFRQERSDSQGEAVKQLDNLFSAKHSASLEACLVENDRKRVAIVLIVCHDYFTLRGHLL
jgi:hypothetical protein